MIQNKSRLTTRIVLVLTCALFAPLAQSQWIKEAQNDIVLVGGSLFDSTTATLVRNPGIAIKNGKITALGIQAVQPTSPDSILIQLDSSATILPGFLDLHAHYNYDLLDRGRAEEVRYTGIIALANGVTSTWSAGEFFPQRVITHRDLIDHGVAIGPRLFASGPYMGGFRCEYQVETAEDDCIAWPNNITEAEIRAEVNRWADQGVISIKIKQATTEETRIIFDQAQQRGMTTAGHLSNYKAEYDVDPRMAIPMGLNRLEHNLTLGNGGPRSAELNEVIQLMLKHQVYFDANLQMYGGVDYRSSKPAFLWTDEAQYFTPYARRLLQERGPPPAESDPEEFAQRQVELRRFFQAGGADLLIVGTDEPVYTTLLPGFAYHRELMAMVDAGIPAAVVLKAATLNGATALGVDDRLGSVEVGKLADLVIVSGNPVEDIATSRLVEWVIKNGDVYNPESLLEEAVGKIGPSGPDDHAGWELSVSPLREEQ